MQWIGLCHWSDQRICGQERRSRWTADPAACLIWRGVGIAIRTWAEMRVRQALLSTLASQRTRYGLRDSQMGDFYRCGRLPARLDDCRCVCAKPVNWDQCSQVNNWLSRGHETSDMQKTVLTIRKKDTETIRWAGQLGWAVLNGELFEIERKRKRSNCTDEATKTDLRRLFVKTSSISRLAKL